MASEHNRIRRKWQDYSGEAAGIAEAAFFECFNKVFIGTDYSIRAKPSEFRNIYLDVPLKPEELAAIYNPIETVTRHGVTPDYAIENIKTGRTIYVEVKRQDGWVAGGIRKDGRGNAHERSSKYFTPGLKRILQEKSRIPPPALPFWTVFQGNITRDPLRVREVTCWYEGFSGHVFFWRDAPNPDLLFAHFEEHIGPLLESDG